MSITRPGPLLVHRHVSTYNEAVGPRHDPYNRDHFTVVQRYADAKTYAETQETRGKRSVPIILCGRINGYTPHSPCLPNLSEGHPHVKILLDYVEVLT